MRSKMKFLRFLDEEGIVDDIAITASDESDSKSSKSDSLFKTDCSDGRVV